MKFDFKKQNAQYVGRIDNKEGLMLIGKARMKLMEWLKSRSQHQPCSF